MSGEEPMGDVMSRAVMEQALAALEPFVEAEQAFPHKVCELEHDHFKAAAEAHAALTAALAGGETDAPSVKLIAETIRFHVYESDDVSDSSHQLIAEEAAQAILAALAVAPETGWCTMDSAPKDGTPVLLFNPTGERDHRWNAVSVWWVAKWRVWADGLSGSWEGYYSGIEPHNEPTHWMPLPPPPGVQT